MTLLELTQNILSDMDGDAVTSYTDTVESQQVAEIIRATYDQIISGRDWPHLYEMFKLSSTTTTQPTRMALPDNLMSLKFIKYNCKLVGDERNRYKKMIFLEPEAFMDMLDSRDSTASNVQVVTQTGSTVSLNIYNDRQPTYYTSFDESAVTFDAFNVAIDTAGRLSASSTQCYGKLYPLITMDDSLVFDLPIEAFPLLQEEAKSTAFLALKQMPNPKAEQHSNTQRRRMAQQSWAIRNGISYQDYGRKRRK